MSMAMWRHERLCVAVHDKTPPTEEEWARWIRLCRDQPGQELCAYVETHGGGPDARQRRALADGVFRRHSQLRAVVLTDSPMVRAILTALGWLGVPVRGFALKAIGPAVTHLGLSADELERLEAELPRLRGEAGVNPD